MGARCRPRPVGSSSRHRTTALGSEPGSSPRTTRRGWVGTPSTPSALTAADVSFRDDILPILGRIVDMQWVNAGFLDSNGWGSGADYLAPDLLERLADPSPASAAVRQQVFEQFRNPDHATEQPDAAPQMYGDGGANPAQSASQWLTVTPIQYALLGAWATGTFTDDRRPTGTERFRRAHARRAGAGARPLRARRLPRRRRTTPASRCRGRCGCP